MRRSSFVLLILLAPSLALAAWPLDGVRLTGAQDDQAGPEMISDGSGGAFVSWADWRNFGALNTGTDLYLQRVSASGLLSPGWPVDGLAVAVGPGTQGNEWRMAPDGSGGVLIVYGDTRFDLGDLYLQRITAAGAVATVVRERLTAGWHDLSWNGRSRSGGHVAAGIYVCRLVAGAHSAERKLVVMP